MTSKKPSFITPIEDYSVTKPTVRQSDFDVDMKKTRDFEAEKTRLAAITIEMTSLTSKGMTSTVTLAFTAGSCCRKVTERSKRPSSLSPHPGVATASRMHPITQLRASSITRTSGSTLTLRDPLTKSTSISRMTQLVSGSMS